MSSGSIVVHPRWRVAMLCALVAASETVAGAEAGRPRAAESGKPAGASSSAAMGAPGAAAPRGLNAGAPKPQQPQVILLRNGRTVYGTVRQEGGRVVIARPGGEFQLPSDAVELVADSLEEVYELKRRRLRPRDPREHLRLAHWCLNQGLLEQARREADAALALDPNSDWGKWILRRLESTQPATGEEVGIRPATEAPEAVAESNQALAEPRGAVAPVGREVAGRAKPWRSANMAAARGSESAVQDRSAGPPPRSSLTAVTHDKPAARPALSEETVAVFTRRVQPLLVNTCTTSGCHGARSPSGFQLMRDRPAGKELTWHNLETVLAWIDREKPAKSKLLAMARSPHGGDGRERFRGLSEARYAVLADWVLALRHEASSLAAPASRSPSGVPAFSAALSANAQAATEANQKPGRVNRPQVKATAGQVRASPGPPPAAPSGRPNAAAAASAPAASAPETSKAGPMIPAAARGSAAAPSVSAPSPPPTMPSSSGTDNGDTVPHAFGSPAANGSAPDVTTEAAEKQTSKMTRFFQKLLPFSRRK